MKKNVAGQVVGAQMVSATDGSAFTGSVTVYVTGDAGAQGVGSVGAGACTHEGNGFHTYAPAQAETNYNHVAFTFIGTGAVPTTLQIYTGFPQTGDSYAEITNGTYGLSAIESLVDGLETTLGAAGAGLSSIPWNASWDAEVQSEVNDGLVAYNAASTTNITAGTITTVTTVNGLAANSVTAAALAADAVTEIQSGLSTLDAAGVRTAVGLAAANLDTQLTAIDDYLDTEVAAIKAKTDSLTFTVANHLDVNVQKINDVTILGDGSGTPFQV